MIRYTLQEAFDKAARGVIAQGKPSHNAEFCLYRGPDGLKCAVGHLLDESMIPPSEIDSPADLLGRFFEIEGAGHRQTVDFLYNLRDAHDRYRHHPNFVEHFKGQMRGLATHLDLDPKVLDEPV